MSRIPSRCLNKDPEEVETIVRLINFLNEHQNMRLEIIDCDAKTDDGIHDFDFLLLDRNSNKKLAVECTRLLESDTILGERRKSEIIIDDLRKRVKEINTDDFYWVKMPLTLPIRLNPADFVYQVFNKIKDFIEKDGSEVIEFNVEGVNFKVEKRRKDSGEDRIKGVQLFPSESGYIPGPSFAPRLQKALDDKNQQLNILQVHSRILLISNQFLMGGDYRITLETIFTLNPNRYKFIDQIYFEIQKNKFYLIYDKDVFDVFSKAKIPVGMPQSLQKLVFDYLPVFIRNDKKKSFSAVKTFIGNRKPSQIFKNPSIKEEIVQFGNWLIERENFNDAIWLIDKFIDDPDPEDPEKYSGDLKFNYHQQIVNGEEPHIITTVLGHLAWVIQKLAVRRKYIVKALDYTKKLLSHKNLYVKLQAIIPLIEIAGRRQWLNGYGRRPRVGRYKEFHKLVFDLVKLVEKNPNYKAIAKYLSHIFFYYKDLSTEEAERVLDALKITDESAGLFVYFGIFRQRYYKEQPVKFDGKRLGQKLKDVIQAENEDYKRLRASIAWHLWKVLDENKKEFDVIKPYIDLFLKQPYQRDLYDDIERIIKDWVKDKPEICIHWFKLMLEQISKFVRSNRQLQKQGGLWLMSTKEIIKAVAKESPNELLELTEKLVNLWKKGVFIGDLKEVFGTFKLIPDKNLRTKAKRKFQEWYKSMKKLNPKLVKVEWD